MVRLALAAAMFAATAPGAAGAADRDAPPPATPNGAPVNCVEIPAIRETQVHGDQVIDFHMRDGTVYRNTLPQSCPELGFERAFSYETSLSRLCNVDIITVFRQSPPLRRGASCGLGPFQPVTLAPKQTSKGGSR